MSSEKPEARYQRLAADYRKRIADRLKADYGFQPDFVALLLIQDDQEMIELVREKEPEAWTGIAGLVTELKERLDEPPAYLVARYYQARASRLTAETVCCQKRSAAADFQLQLSRLMINPVTGLPILFLILYFGLYLFVGRFGAGVLVDLLEEHLFNQRLTPWLTGLSNRWLPWPALRELFTGEYGIITLGVRYAVALILPIVTTFFLAFAVLEDTGYLPRLALLLDRFFKKIGLTGRAVIPLVLGLGCDTMATLVTRTLPTRRERFIATLLLALAVPCAAQLGVIFSLLAEKPAGIAVWALIILAVFLLAGFLASRLVPGEPPDFYLEIPLLRRPSFSNLLVKTGARIKWYFLEIMPMFVFASLLIWAGRLSHLFDLLVRVLTFPVRWLGLPAETAVAFLFGFFRRDYGAGGLYDLKKAGLLSGNQLLVAAVTLTLFLPCVAQFLMNIKERGWRVGVSISLFTLFFSFTVGFCLNLGLNLLGINL